MVTHAATEKLTEEEVFKKGIKQIFRICTPTYQDGNAAAFVAKDLPANTWATISPKYEYGYTSWDMFKDTLGKLKPGVQFIGRLVGAVWDDGLPLTHQHDHGCQT